jgi:teichoic acid transport system permease protein
MNALARIVKEQFTSFPLIIRLAIYETKSTYQMNYLGVFWQFLNPLIQMVAYWFVFGMGIREGHPVPTGAGDVPFILWMLAGLIPWFFISPTVLDGANSVFRRINLVAKMNFPISSLPSVVIASNLFSYFVMTAVYVIVLLLNGVYPSLHWIQFIYYFICMVVFMFAFSLFNSTISVLVRDYQLLLQAVIRLLFFLLPIFWDISKTIGQKFPDLLPVLKLNPFFYIIDGFRDSFLDGQWFFQDMKYTIYFWVFTLFLLTIGSVLHMKFRDRFVDFL